MSENEAKTLNLDQNVSTKCQNAAWIQRTSFLKVKQNHRIRSSHICKFFLFSRIPAWNLKIKSSFCKRWIFQVWLAHEDGEYDNHRDTSTHSCRGKFIADEKGRYEVATAAVLRRQHFFFKFWTLKPVPYGSGSRMRPAHFHVKVVTKQIIKQFCFFLPNFPQ